MAKNNPPSGEGTTAAPAEKKLTADKASEKQLDAYYDTMRQAKRDAGLSLELALEVTARQRKEDIANGAELELDATED